MEREQLKITKLKSPGMPDTVPACSLAQAPSRPNGSSPLGHPSSTSSSTHRVLLFTSPAKASCEVSLVKFSQKTAPS